MVRLILIALLILFIARTFWRVIDGVLDGMRHGAARRAPESRSGVHMARDPVCGTFVIPERAVTIDDGTRQIHFCSTACRDTFRARMA
jgi:YHS domain-containing protein